MKRYIPAALFVVMLGSVGPVLARGPGGDGGPGGRGGRFSGAIHQLVFPCAAACRAAADECREGVEATTLDCVAVACPSEVTAAQEACATDRTADTCRTAIDALRDCGAGCIDTDRTNHTVCRTVLHDCVDACSAE